MVMERRGWRKAGRKGSVGVRADTDASHNTGGLAFWFIRAERYELNDGMPFQSVRQRCEAMEISQTDGRRRKKSRSRSR